MNLNDILVRRRSVRKFTDKRVDAEVISRVLNAALLAPSSRNSRSTKFLVVEDKDKIERLSSMRDYGSSFLKYAPTAIVVMGDTSVTDLWEVNCSISATVVQLACVDQGLASCWVHVDGRPQKRDYPEGDTAEEWVRECVSIPENHRVLCVIACGYSDFEPAALPEVDLSEKIIFE